MRLYRIKNPTAFDSAPEVAMDVHFADRRNGEFPYYIVVGGRVAISTHEEPGTPIEGYLDQPWLKSKDHTAGFMPRPYGPLLVSHESDSGVRHRRQPGHDDFARAFARRVFASPVMPTLQDGPTGLRAAVARCARL